MVSFRYTPQWRLQDFISQFILIHRKVDQTGLEALFPFPPQPGHSLYFFPYDKVTCFSNTYQHIVQLPQQTIVGPQLTRVDLCMGSHMLIIIVNFHPSGLHRLLRRPMHEMVDQYFDAALLLGPEIEQVSIQLREESNFDRMIAVIEAYLLKMVKRLKPLLPVDRVLKQMLVTKKMLNISQLAQMACVSKRQLERQFRERIGLSPVLFSRLQRFDNSRILSEEQPQFTWLQIAAICGYADQTHMIRAFKDFAGTTPELLKKDIEKSCWRLLYRTIV
ncbi:AraC family transcriptional regulator [Pedobacter immunditicola]|uniref:AraC family transcriptional regulator n=1 Tax=Pedobacter immunditicola TaxID=3133440 RepID=UPI0030983D54